MMRDTRKFKITLKALLTCSLQITIFFFAIPRYQSIHAFQANFISDLRRDEPPYPNYKYSYDIRNIDGGQHGHQVSRDGIHTSGKYYVNLNNGATQHVEYYTDDLGYHPKVTYSNALDSAQSGARLSFGVEARPINLTKLYKTDTASPATIVYTTTEHVLKSSTESSQTPAKIVASDITSENNQYLRVNDIKSNNIGLRLVDNKELLNSIDVGNNNLMPNFDFVNVSSNENQEMAYSISPVNSVNSIFLTNPSNIPVDAYLQPEINEITNGFVGKIVSVVPGILTMGTKLLKPIIVTDNVVSEVNQPENTSVNFDWKSDQSFESAQMQEYRETSPYEELLSVTEKQTSTPRYERKEENLESELSKKKLEPQRPKTEVDIEPQMIEEQAVITTTVDIAKSLPLTMNFISDVDNHLNEQGQAINFGQSVNAVPPNTTPQIHFLPHPNMFLVPKPTMDVPYNNARLLRIQFPQNLPTRPAIIPHQVPGSNAPAFQYIPIPIFQHQPNLIPLNLANDINRNPNYGSNTVAAAEVTPDSPDNSNQPRSNEIQSQTVKNTIDETISKRENNAAKSSVGSILTNVKSSEFQEQKFNKHLFASNEPVTTDLRRPFSLPYAFNVPATHLIPYVKHITNSPNALQTHPFPHHLLKQQQNSINAVPRAHSVAYNIKLFPKEIRKPRQKSPPFRPSHPVWDSIYPPQHMYYVPYYIADKMPGERKARDSSSRRNHHLRRLYVEYGGFKPPMIPSTLLENEETSDKLDGPEESAQSS